MGIGTLVLIGIGIVVVLVAVIVLDLLFAGGAMTMGTMHGMAMMVSNPSGRASCSCCSPFWACSCTPYSFDERR